MVSTVLATMTSVTVPVDGGTTPRGDVSKMRRVRIVLVALAATAAAAMVM